MKTKSLLETNPYLKNASERRRLVARSVRTSCGVEGIQPHANAKKIEITHRKPKKIHSAKKPIRSAAS